MKTDIFNLQIIPIDHILPHEFFDNSRSKLLAGKLKKDNVLCNPIIVAPLSRDKYVQLDGMNRLSTFKVMGFKSILCQIVDYQDMGNVELASWVHFINTKEQDFLNHIKTIQGLEVENGSIDQVINRYIQSEGEERICTYISEDLKVFFINYNGSLIEKVEKLGEIVNYYRNDIVRDVLPQNAGAKDIKFLFKEHFKHRHMVVFPTFTRHQIVKVVRKGKLFPAGVTRHVIRRRCLNVNLPFNLFNNGMSVTMQNQKLEEMLRSRKFRLYEESTIYFE